MRFLRFDRKSDREVRLQTDKFAMFSQVWKAFVDNCISAFKPKENLTIDEQLIPCKTRCRFIQYMPNKPDKFGIKLWALVDVETKYFLNGSFYLGKDDNRDPKQSLSHHVVKKLCQPYSKKGYNITCDNFFTSLSLAKELKSNSISIVGTMRMNRRELPNLARNNEKFDLYQTRILKTEGAVTLLMYQAKKNKKISILSTLHNDIDIQVNGKKKPETILFYNKTKCGVDVLDQMLRKYSVKACSRRWPVVVFYNMIDIALLNSWIIYRKANGINISRRDFIMKVVEELRNQDAQQQSSCGESSSVSTDPHRRRQCQVKLNCSQNKTTDKCAKCFKFVCGKCSAKKMQICINCDI